MRNRKKYIRRRPSFCRMTTLFKWTFAVWPEATRLFITLLIICKFEICFTWILRPARPSENISQWLLKSNVINSELTVNSTHTQFSSGTRGANFLTSCWRCDPRDKWQTQTLYNIQTPTCRGAECCTRWTCSCRTTPACRSSSGGSCCEPTGTRGNYSLTKLSWFSFPFVFSLRNYEPFRMIQRR